MGLDVYVGPLTRHVAGDWETVVQTYARQHGLAFSIQRGTKTTLSAAEAQSSHGSLLTKLASAIKDGVVGAFADELGGKKLSAPVPEQRQPKSKLDAASKEVAAWLDGLNTLLKDELKRPLEWKEDPDAPYFTDKPDWDGYASLLVAAAHWEHPEFERPFAAVRNWTDDLAWRACVEHSSESSIGALLLPEIWLPCEFDFMFKAELAAGQQVWFASCSALLSALERLNKDLFKLNEGGLEATRQRGVQDSLQGAAQFGFAVFMRLARAAVAHRLPMRLDY